MTRGVELDVGVGAPAPRRAATGLTYDAHVAIAHLRSIDSQLDDLIEHAGPFEVAGAERVDPFAYLLRSIIHQQLNGTAARTIHARVKALFPNGEPDPIALLEIDDTTLREAGLSASKIRSVHDLARHTLDGTVPEAQSLAAMSDLELIERFTVVRGIGPWTVQMLLLFQLGRPDVLPTGDFGVREGFRLMRGAVAQPTPGELRAAAEPWRPYRSVAAWYLWRAVDLVRDAGWVPGDAAQ